MVAACRLQHGRGQRRHGRSRLQLRRLSVHAATRWADQGAARVTEQPKIDIAVIDKWVEDDKAFKQDVIARLARLETLLLEELVERRLNDVMLGVVEDGFHFDAVART